MKKLFIGLTIVFLLNSPIVCPAGDQDKQCDFMVDSRTLKYLNQTYGFLSGQDFTMSRIENEIPELSAQVTLVKSKFAMSFGPAAKNIETTLSDLYKGTWPELKSQNDQQLKELLSKSTLTRKAAIKFIRLVESRSNGQIETPFLQTLLMFAPEFQRNPKQEVIMGFKNLFRTDEHPKAKNLDFQIEYPKSWLAKEGHRPNVIQLFRSSYGKGLSLALIMTKDIAAEANGSLSLRDLNQLKTLKGAKEVAAEFFTNQNLKTIAKNMGMTAVRKIHSKRMVIDRWPGAMLDFIGEQQRLDIVLTTFNRTYFAIYKHYMITLQCQVFKLPAEDQTSFSRRIARYLPLFHWMSNSLVIQSQY